MRLPPLTLDSGGDPGEHLASANRAAPTGTPAAEQTASEDVWNVVPVDPGGASLDQEPAELWQISARFTATAGDSAAEITLWCWDFDALQWYPTGSMSLVATPTTQIGGILETPGRFGTTHTVFGISGLGDGDAIALMMREKRTI
jgi:hypothetical protein